MSDKSSKKTQWKASFILSTSVPVREVKSLKGIEFVIEDKARSEITGINIITPEMTYLSAVTYAEIICNRCVDYLSFLSRLPVIASLRQMNEISKIAVKSGYAMFSANAILAKRKDLDITNPAFQRALRNEDMKLALQLAHFRRGMLAKDVIEKIREFFQVLELERSPATETYKYVRHLVSHPELSKTKSVEEAIKIIGKPYLDPSAPQDLRKMEKDASAIEKEARSIIQNKLKRTTCSR